MENNFLPKIGEWITEQSWFQNIRSKWEELDVESRHNLKIAGIGGGSLLAIFLVGYGSYSVHSLKAELTEKQNLLYSIQGANDQLHSGPVGSTPSDAGKENWTGYLQATATQAGLDLGSLTLSADKNVGASEQAAESEVDIAAKHINIRQAFRYAFMLENGTKPVKVRNILVDTKGDPSGYVDVNYVVSAFSFKDVK